MRADFCMISQSQCHVFETLVCRRFVVGDSAWHRLRILTCLLLYRSVLCVLLRLWCLFVHLMVPTSLYDPKHWAFHLDAAACVPIFQPKVRTQNHHGF